MISLHVFAEDECGPAAHLGAALSCPPATIAVQRFADGETLPRVTPPAPHALLYRSLHDPNGKLIEALLAADALRRAGAHRLTLIAPYLPYLRQDMVFQPGEPLSRDVVIPLLAAAFDAIVTVDPHLHRTKNLSPIAPRADWRIVSGAAAIADALKQDAQAFDLVVGPDSESTQWVKAIAGALDLPFWTFAKRRLDDRKVCLEPPQNQNARAARVLIVDDVCSSGGTLAEAARALRTQGAVAVEAAITHALFDKAAAAVMRAAGLVNIRSCDGCPHPTNAFRLAPALAAAIKQELEP